MEAKKPIEKELLTINEVAELLRVHPQTLRRWDGQGKLKAIRVGGSGHRKYSRKQIETLIQSNKM